MAELFDTTNLEAVLQDIARDIRENYREHFIHDNRNASGQLLDTMRADVEVNGTVWSVTLTLQDYWKYIEEGTRPHWPPRSAILRWIEVKPVIPYPDSRGRIPTMQQLAFMISRKIAREGTRGDHNLQRTKDAVLPFYMGRLADALQRDTVAYIRKLGG